MYNVSFSKQAYKSLASMPKNTAQNIVGKIKLLAEDPYAAANVKKLTEHPGYRLRVSDWRLIYTINDKELLIHIIKLASRGDVYK